MSNWELSNFFPGVSIKLFLNDNNGPEILLANELTCGTRKYQSLKHPKCSAIPGEGFIEYRNEMFFRDERETHLLRV